MAVATSADLALYLDLSSEALDAERATFMISQAEALAKTYISPVPNDAKAVIVSAAARAYVNPAGASYEVAGPFAHNPSTGGVYFTRAERGALRKLRSGARGAFTVNPTSRAGEQS